jgi:hypothetical protein
MKSKRELGRLADRLSGIQKVSIQDHSSDEIFASAQSGREPSAFI